MKLFNPLTLLLILMAAAMLGYHWWRSPTSSRDHPVERLTSYQGADTPLMFPEDGRLRHRLHQFSAWQLATLPRALRFDAPMGAENGAMTYNAQPFWKMNSRRGGHHTGDDLNGLGGMDTDLGDPVYASADGMVVYAGEPSPGWGKVVVVAHRGKDDRVLQSMHAHLHRIDVPVGALVARGQPIGQVGTANGTYPAHLHFEMREGDGVDLGAGYSMLPLNRLDPEETLAALRGAPADRPAPSMLPAALDRERLWNRLEIRGAEKLGELRD